MVTTKLHYIYKSMWTPLQLVDLGISATPVADRCIAHRHAISIDKHWLLNGLTEELSNFQSGTVIGCHLSNTSVRQIYVLLELPRLCWYCEVETSMSNNGSAVKW
jgi:hypothetical protein